MNNVWTDALSVLTGEWQLVAVILVFVFFGQSLIHLCLKGIFENRLTPAEYLSLGLAGWLLPALLISLLWYLTRLNVIVWILLATLILYFLIRLPLRGLRKLDYRSASVSRVLFIILTVFLFALLRLVYVSNALFPLYFDSAQHYSVIKNIVQQGAVWVFNWLNIVYYHLGFHFLTAFFASVLNMEITRSMLVLGQVILALIPFSVFFPVRHATKSNAAGWFAVLLSAFGWYMPAHAIDWGKYPALMSLGMIPFTLNLIYLLKSQNPDSINLPVKIRWVLYGFIGLSALLTVFTHSRSLIVLGIVCLAWILSVWWQKLPKRQVVFLVIVIITLLEAIFILKQSVLVLLFDPYLYKGILITGLILFLSIFAWTGYPRLTFIIVLTTTLLLASLFIQVTILPGYRDLTLLDRPFVEMILFMPLSMLGGLGLSGLEKKLQGRFVWSRYVGLLALGIVIVNAYFTYDLYPSDCCVIVGNDDVVAMDWLANELPIDARIGISSTQLRVLTLEASEGDVGADAGIWITPLTGRVTVSLPYNTDFNDSVTWKTICEEQVDYLFVGEVGYPFDGGKIDAHPEWYRPLLSMPKTRVYEVIGCN
jgi:hypothetical protein